VTHCPLLLERGGADVCHSASKGAVWEARASASIDSDEESGGWHVVRMGRSSDVLARRDGSCRSR